MKINKWLATILMLVIAISGLVAIAMAAEAIDPGAILDKANLKNGESIYNTGKRAKGAHLAFTAGPNWLHVEGGGCAECHGKRGWGNTMPTFCTTRTPPVTYKYLAGNGYPFTARQDGSHPVYTMRAFKTLMRAGIKSNGYEADFCMPRYRISVDELRDLMGYLIKLDDD